jgi:single-strand DNA-binding protein
MNNVVLIGRLTSDPEMRFIPQSETAVSNFSLAVDRPFSKGKEKVADFIRIVAFGKTAELVEKYVTKGKRIGVIGRIQTGNYKDKDGKTIYTTDVVAERIEFLDSGNKKGSESDEYSQEDGAGIPKDFTEEDDEIPF